MKKEKIAIVMAAILLFGGLGTFVFANGSHEELEKKPNKNIKQIEDKEEEISEDKKNNKKENKEEAKDKTIVNNKTEQKDNNSSSTLSSNKKEEVNEKKEEPKKPENETTKIKIEDIKKAVSSILNSLDINELYKAENLVNKLEDSKEKTELKNKIKELENLIETKNYVKKLEDLVNKAQNKNDMIMARDFYQDFKVLNKVESLKDEKVKLELKNVLNKLSDRLNDIENPFVTGIENNGYYQNISSVNISDISNYIIKLNNQIISLEDLKKVNSEGVYNLVVVDNSFNEIHMNFTIDNTAPIITLDKINANNIYHEEVTPLVSDKNIDKITLNGELYTSGTSIKDFNDYTLVAIDKAGNETQMNFTIRKIKVNIEVIKPENLVYDGTAKEFSAKLIDEYGNPVLGNVNISYNKQTTKPVNAGDYVVNFHYAGNEIYEGAFVQNTYKIEKASYEINVTEPTDFNYDGTPKTYKAVLKSFEGEREIAVVYKDKDNKKLDSAPVNAGEYKAIVYDKGTNNYNGVYKEFKFEIKKVDAN